MKQQPYGTIKKCPKCGSENILRVYRASQLHGNGISFFTIPEHMEANCGFCKYQTKENCLDFIPEEIPNITLL